MKSRVVDGVDYGRVIEHDQCKDFIQGMKDYKALDQLWYEFAGWENEAGYVSDEESTLIEKVIARIENQKMFIRRRWSLEEADLKPERENSKDAAPIKNRRKTKSDQSNATGVVIPFPAGKST